MNATEVRSIVCPRCSTQIDVCDNFCPHCGGAVREFVPLPPGHAPISKEKAIASRTKLCDNPWFVLSLMFLALGPFALPLLWRSRGFSPFWKTLLTVVMLAFTALLVFAIWFIVTQSQNILDELKLIEGF